MQTFKPNRLKTMREKVNYAKRDKHRLDRPNTEDMAWWDATGEIDRLRDDGERSGTMPSSQGSESQP